MYVKKLMMGPLIDTENWRVAMLFKFFNGGRGVGVNKKLCYELNYFSVIKFLFEIKYISLACSG